MTSWKLVACDGSALRKPSGELGGAIGWAWAAEDGTWASAGAIEGTNQRAELHALLLLLVQNPKTALHIQLDSQYTKNVAEKWRFGWSKKNWVKADGKPVLNRDIIDPLHSILQNRTEPVKFEWVKGHDKSLKSPLNHAADEYAGLASRRARDEFLLESNHFYLDSKGRNSLPSMLRIMNEVKSKGSLRETTRLHQNNSASDGKMREFFGG